jgi:hypothetical protein
MQPADRVERIRWASGIECLAGLFEQAGVLAHALLLRV